MLEGKTNGNWKNYVKNTNTQNELASHLACSNFA